MITLNEIYCEKCNRSYQTTGNTLPRHDCVVRVKLHYYPINFTKALIVYFRSGRKKVTKQQYLDRLETCNKCFHYLENKCTVCGCKLAGKIFTKAMLPHEKCPVGKWPILENASTTTQHKP